MRFWGRGLREGFSVPVVSAAGEPALSDLRGFTNLADRLDDYELTAVLNVYFDRLAGAVMHHGGEVLKFIGDGMLAVFPFKKFDRPSLPADRLGTPQALRP